MTTTPTLIETNDHPAPGECWCCGAVDDPARTVHLGNHPEVVLCRGCARWAAKRAWEIDDRDKAGPLVAARSYFREARTALTQRGWHRSRIFGGPVRWLGKRLP